MNLLHSFKLKLVAYFVLLSILPLTAAYWGFGAVAGRSVTSTADARLEAGVRAALAAYDDELRRAAASAESLASDRELQLALIAGDRAAVAAKVAAVPNARVRTSRLSIGPVPPLAAERSVALAGPGLREAVVVVSVPLDRSLVARLRARSGLGADDTLLLVRDHRIVAASGAVAGTLQAPEGRFETVTMGGERYRGVAVELLPEQRVSLAAVTPQSAVDADRQALERRLLLALAGALALIALVAYFAGRSIVGSLGRLAAAANSIAAGRLGERVPARGRDEFARLATAFNDMAEQLEQRLADLEAERERLRAANLRFGEALAATLDAGQLMRVIVETAVEATGATGAVLTSERGQVVQAGDPSAGSVRLELPLSAGQADFGTLVLTGDHFDDEERMTAASLAGQAVVALENVRLHRIIERQALLDGLTGLANRRQADEHLSAEIARAERFGGAVALILADLDDFKSVNDRHGHPTGDAVLQAFAETLRRSLREIDLAARWGGEEFAIVLPAADTEGALQTAERIRSAFEEQTVKAADGAPLHVTASFGVASFPAFGSREKLLAAADDALYRAKRAGKNRVVAAEERLYRL